MSARQRTTIFGGTHFDRDLNDVVASRPARDDDFLPRAGRIICLPCTLNCPRPIGNFDKQVLLFDLIRSVGDAPQIESVVSSGHATVRTTCNREGE